MVESVLRIIFDGNDARLRTKAALAQRLDDHAHSEVVVCDLCAWAWRFAAGASGVVVGQRHLHELRELSDAFPLPQVVDERLRTDDIRHVQIPADCVEVRDFTQTLHAGFTADFRLACFVLPVVVKVAPGGLVLLGRVGPLAVGNARLAILAETHAVLHRVVPYEAAGRVCEGIEAVLGLHVHVAARPVCMAAFHILGGKCGVAPLMAVCALDARAIRVVEQHEIAGHLVEVRRVLLTKNA